MESIEILEVVAVNKYSNCSQQYALTAKIFDDSILKYHKYPRDKKYCGTWENSVTFQKWK